MTEELLREDFIKYLEQEGCTEYAKEVQLFPAGNLIDLVYLDRERKFIAVELKLTDWRKVIQQALKVKQFTRLVYIAMPLPATITKRNKIETIVKDLNLGLFWFNKEGQWICHKSPEEDTSIKFGEGFEGYYNKLLEQNMYIHYHFTFIAPFLGKAATISRNLEYKTKNVIW